MKHRSSLYPTNRDVILKSAERWMSAKRKDDNVGKNLWRVHDKLYDLTEFANRHPGGKFWIEETEGTDVTEAFESSHIDGVEHILKKYFVGQASSPRKSQFTFYENGFYKTLKRRVKPILKKVGNGPSLSMLVIQDCLSTSAMITMCVAAYTNSIFMACVAGILLGMSTSCAHSFFHQRDTWRRFYWDLSLITSRDWRITHGISHHLFPNTLNDFEVSGLEPFIFFLPEHGKNAFVRYAPYIYWHLLAFIAFHIELLKRIILIVFIGEQKLRFENLLPVVEFLVMVALYGSFDFRVFLMWFIMHGFASYWFIVTSVSASHHHPLIYHEGDEQRQDRDWGLFQIDATRDVAGKSENFFLVVTTFGNHTLHHLFPTIDQSKLHHLYPTFAKTCSDFGVNYEPRNVFNMFVGTHLQMSRTTISKCSTENGRLANKK